MKEKTCRSPRATSRELGRDYLEQLMKKETQKIRRIVDAKILSSKNK